MSFLCDIISLHYGGFAGLREHRIVMDRSVFHTHKERGTLDGIGSFVYMADAAFMPHGETRMHGHREVDVISVIVEGSINHEGSLEHGVRLNAGDVQVQRSGKEGFSHNEINPDAKENRMIQLWFMPQNHEEKASYKVFNKSDTQVQEVYSIENTTMHLIQLKKDESYHSDSKFQAYMIEGSATANDSSVVDGNFFEDETMQVYTKQGCRFITISVL